jgi:hypothetical protein
MRILVIGGTGFLGTPLVRQLVAMDHQVAVFHRGQTVPHLPDGVSHLLGDRDHLPEHADELRRLRPDVVIDMIAYYEAHALGLLEVFLGVAGRAVVLTSGDVYRAYGVFHGTEPRPLTHLVRVGDAPCS